MTSSRDPLAATPAKDDPKVLPPIISPRVPQEERRVIEHNGAEAREILDEMAIILELDPEPETEPETAIILELDPEPEPEPETEPEVVTADHRPKALIDNTPAKTSAANNTITPPREEQAAMPPPTTPVVKKARKTFNLTEAVQQFNVDHANMHIVEVSDNELATAFNDDNDDEDEVEVDTDNDDDDEDRALIIPDNVHIDLTRSIPPPPVSPRLVEGITSTIRNIHVVNERSAATTRVAPPGCTILTAMRT